MGRFLYSDRIRGDFDDRALAHLQAVIVAKLRRGESFAFSWAEEQSTGGGRTVVWISDSSNISFRYHGSRVPPLNPEWLSALSVLANSPAGLRLVPESSGRSSAAAPFSERTDTITVSDTPQD